MKISYHSKTDKGKVRNQNEDSFFSDPSLGLIMVADGMGGYQCGDTASQLVLTSMYTFLKFFSINGQYTETQLFNGINFANKMVYNFKRVNLDIKNMGTTLVGMSLSEDGGKIFNVGDSRCYVFRNQQLKQITKDHSAEDDLPDFMKGLAGGRYSNLVSRAIGTDITVEPDFYEFTAEENDILLFCSDGLYKMLDDSVITKALSDYPSIHYATERLVEKACQAGGKDNVTVTLMQFKEVANKNYIEILPALK